MSLSVSSVSANPAPVAQVAAPAPQAAVAPSAPVEAATVQISVAAQVRQLDASGSTVAQIATKLNLDAATVKQYLG